MSDSVSPSSSSELLPKSPPSSSEKEEKKLNSAAEEFKTQGNKKFEEKHFQQALDLYTKAIELDGSVPAYYCNRAFCHLRLEAYGAAISDADTAVSLDPKFIKAYYRRGAGHLALGKYKDARKDFLQVTRIKPSDKDAKSKLQECEKAIRSEAFLKAIESEKTKPASETIAVTVKSIEVADDYSGPRLEGEEGNKVTEKFFTDLVEHFKAQKKLHRKYVYHILLQIIPLLRSLPTLIDIDIPASNEFTVCGDVHGQFYDVLNIWKLNGMPSTSNPYLFNGDFVDRGSFSVEVIVTFFTLKLLYPSHFHLTRGNHESLTMNSIYGFQGEVTSKIDSDCFPLFTEAFNYLPLAACLNKKVLVLHGGLFSEDGVTLDQLRKVDRNQQPPESGLMCEMLWSDPQNPVGRAPSKRGVGLSFGPDVTAKFLKNNNLELVVRSHEVKEDGYEIQHNGQCITVFSAPNYCDSMGNKGALIRFEGTAMKPKFTTYNAVTHPSVQPMAYAGSLFRGGF